MLTTYHRRNCDCADCLSVFTGARMRYLPDGGVLVGEIARPSTTEVPTIFDLAEYGVRTCLDLLRQEWDGHYGRLDQYRGMTADTAIGLVQRDMGRKFTQARLGDMVLVHLGSVTPVSGTAYCPRVGWNCVYLPGDVRVISARR